jgi:putative transposase
VIAPSAQSGPRSSAEPTARPGIAGQVAMKRGRDPASRLGNNPETGCRRVTHYDSLIFIGNGIMVSASLTSACLHRRDRTGTSLRNA